MSVPDRALFTMMNFKAVLPSFGKQNNGRRTAGTAPFGIGITLRENGRTNPPWRCPAAALDCLIKHN